MKILIRIILWIIATILLSLIILFLIPIKGTITLNNETIEKYKGSQETVLVCRHVQVTDGDWYVEEVLAGDTKNVGQYIKISGYVPVIDYHRFSNGLAGGDRFLFIGFFADGENSEGTKNFISNQWHVIYPYITGDVIRWKKSYLNIFDFMKLVKRDIS